LKLISITGNKKSKLAHFSDIVLEARVEKEAEPNGLVPTASSTAALAMGDALAIALMKQKGFGESDFAIVHPKGQAGKKLIKINQLMRKGRQIASVPLSAPMRGVLEEMSQKKLGMTCVVDGEERLVGIITDGDLRRKIQEYGKKFIEKTAQDCMTTNPKTIRKEELATTALNIMEENKITSLIIKDEQGKIEGLLPTVPSSSSLMEKSLNPITSRMARESCSLTWPGSRLASSPGKPQNLSKKELRS